MSRDSNLQPLNEKFVSPEPGAFYVKKYNESVVPFGRSRVWKPSEATRLHFARTSAEEQDWEQRSLTES